MEKRNRTKKTRGSALVLSLALGMVLIWITFQGVTHVLASVHQEGAGTHRFAGGAVPPESNSLLAVYVLAYDNDPAAAGTVNLTRKYSATVQGIAAATGNLANVTAVILADLDQAHDTHVLVAQNGVITPVAGLPDAGGVLDPTLDEYNSADGATLGGFLIWARQQFPAAKTLFSYIGHGGPLAPYTEPPIADIITNTLPARDTAVPMPMRVGAHQDYTDQHVPGSATPRLVTPHDLALALQMGTAGGSNPVAVLDLVHCFAASIEQIYELAPYAETAVAAPNYAFFDPAMSGAALAELGQDPNLTPVEMANTILGKYFDLLPPNRHPHVMIAIDNSKVPQIKQAWDSLAQALLVQFQQAPALTAAAIYSAYQASETFGSLYDSTFCGDDPDYELAPPDALADIGAFSQALSQELPPVAVPAQAAYVAINDAVTTQANQNGYPWWDPTPTYWNFNGTSGIAIFAPFQPMAVNNTQFHAWQSLWYTDTILIAANVPIGSQLVDVRNPHPYAFIQANSGGATWADVVEAYWQQTQTHPRRDLGTAMCLPDVREYEEPDLSLQGTGSADVVWASHELTLTWRVVNETTLSMAGVAFTQTLPAGVTLLSVSGSNCQQQVPLIICVPGTLAGHESITITVALHVNLDTKGILINEAVVGSGTPENHPYNNQGVVSTHVRAAWQMGLAGSVNAGVANEGEVIRQTAVLQNTGIATTTGTLLSGLFPADVTVAGPVTIVPPNAGFPGAGSVLAHIPSLAPGERVSVTVPLLLRDGPAVITSSILVTSIEVVPPLVSSVIVTIVNVPPEAVADAYVMKQGRVLTVPAPGLLLNDWDVGADTLAVRLHTPPAHGQVTLHKDGAFVYLPEPSFFGRDWFTYLVVDEDNAQSGAVVVEIEVLAQYYLPIAFRH